MCSDLAEDVWETFPIAQKMNLYCLYGDFILVHVVVAVLYVCCILQIQYSMCQLTPHMGMYVVTREGHGHGTGVRINTMIDRYDNQCLAKLYLRRFDNA